jgi:hypothetical protein
MDGVNQDEGEGCSTTFVAVRNPSCSAQRCLTLFIDIQLFTDAINLFSFKPVNEIHIVYVSLVVVDLTIFVTSVKVLEISRESKTCYWSTMVLDSMDKMSIWVTMIEIEDSYGVIHITTSIQVVSLSFIIIVLLENVVKPICHMLVP